MYLCKYGFDVFHRGVQRKLSIIRGRFDSEFFFFDPCIWILVIRKAQKVQLILSHLKIHTFSVHTGLMSSVKVWIDSANVERDYAIEQPVFSFLVLECW